MLVMDASLSASLNAGRFAGMDQLRKITVQVPERTLEAAQAYTGEGVTETVRAGLEKLLVEHAQREFRKLRGSFRFTIDLDTLREDRQW